MRRTGDPQREKYISPAEKYLTKSVAYIRELDKSIQRLETAQTGYDTAMQGILRECGYSDELPAGQQAQGEVVVAPSEHGSFLRSKLNAKNKAFKEILTDLHKTLQMPALPDISDDMTGNELVTVYKSTKLTSHQLSCLSTLGVQLDGNWSQEVPILDNTFFTAYRFPINVAARSTLEPPKEDHPCKEEMKMSELDIRIKFSWSVPSCGEAIYYSYQYSLTSIFYYFIPFLGIWVHIFSIISL